MKNSFRGVLFSWEFVVVSYSNQSGLQSAEKTLSAPPINVMSRFSIAILASTFHAFLSWPIYRLYIRLVNYIAISSHYIGLQMKSETVELSVLFMTSVLCSNRDGGKSTFLSITGSELQLELTASLMTPFLYLPSCTLTQCISYTHLSVRYELWFHSTNTVLENIVGMRFVSFWDEDDLPA